MAAGSDAIWAVDLGNCSLKALHLMAVGDVVQVIGFDHIPHGKIISSGVSATEREELIAITLRQFVQRNEVEYDPLIVSVPSQNSFARFVTLPPVEAKKIPEIVQFEAAQQIPFDISEVQWDWQLMTEADSPEKRVGIFAIKNEVVSTALEQFEREDLQVSYVQMAPMALYNYLVFDRPDLVNSDKRATVVINIGADSTDLVVCTASNVWQRCIVMGGNAFTQAIADAFKLNFEKAEKLKRTAPVSKYARQIFQAMRPVFTDLAGEVQRSVGFYTSSNPDVKIARVVGMGGGTKLRGLLKYLSQTLQIPVEKPDAYKRLAIAPGLSSAKFHENVADFGVVYGLGLQGLGMARIESNLLPTSVARSMAWAGKTKFFIGAAVLLLLVSLMCLGRVGWDKITYARQQDTRARTKTRGRPGSGARPEQGQRRAAGDGHPGKGEKVLPVIRVPGHHAEAARASHLRAAECQEQPGAAGALRGVRRRRRRQGHGRPEAPEEAALHHPSVSLLCRQPGVGPVQQVGPDAQGPDDPDDGRRGIGAYDTDMMAEMEQIYGKDYLQQAGMLGTGQETVKETGFVVTIAGYSPYERYRGSAGPDGRGEPAGQVGPRDADRAPRQIPRPGPEQHPVRVVQPGSGPLPPGKRGRGPGGRICRPASARSSTFRTRPIRKRRPRRA